MEEEHNEESGVGLSQPCEVIGTQNVGYDGADDENDGFYPTLGIAGVQSGNVVQPLYLYA